MAKPTPNAYQQVNRKRPSFSTRIKPFSGFLWKLVYFDEIVSIGELAELWDVSPKTVYAMTEGRRSVSPERIRKLFLYTGSHQVLDYFLNQSEYVLIQKQAQPKGEAVVYQGLGIMDLAGRVAREIKTAMEDKRLTDDEKAGIHNRIEPLLKALMELDMSLAPGEYDKK